MNTKNSLKIAGTLLLLALLMTLVLDRFVIPAAIRSKLSQLQPAGMQLEIGNVQIHFFSRSIQFKNIKLSDAAKRLQVDIAEIQFKTIRPISFLLNREINFGELHLRHPKIVVYRGFELPDSVQIHGKPKKSVSASLNKLRIDDAEFCLLNQSERDTVLSGRLSLDADSINIEKNRGKYRYKNLGMNEFLFSIKEFSYFSPDSISQLKLDSACFDTAKQQLALYRFKLIPLLGRYQLGKQKGVQSDWISAQTARVEINQFELDQLFSNGLFRMQSIEIDSLKLDIFKDQRLPFPDKADTKLPGELIASIPVPFHCDTVSIRHSSIGYSERVPKSQQAGTFNFTALNATITQLSNVDSLLRQPTSLSATTMVMGQTGLRVSAQFANARFPHANRITGELAPTSFPIFNTITSPNMAARFTEGTLSRFSFDFYYSDSHSQGKLLMDYRGLKLELLSREPDKNYQLENLLLNALVVKTDNLPEKRRYREGKIDCERDKKRSFLNYWWKSVLSGVKSVVIP